jgi:hypothetical protein
MSMLGCNFLFIKNISWFTAPGGCLVAKTFYCLAAYFLSSFYNIVLPSLHAVVALFWY